MKAAIEYRDASNLSDAAERADSLPERRQALEGMGFKHVGFVEARLNRALIGDATTIFKDKADAEFASKPLANGGVTEIMTSPDEIASVELERFFESQLLEFRTIFENGVIVETSIRPVRLPKHKDLIQPIRDVFESKPIQKFLDWIIGGSQWIASHRPGAGYHFAFMDNPTSQEIWARHKQRVEAFARKQRTRIPPQSDIRLFFAITARRHQINRFQERFVSAGEKAIFALLLLVLAAFFILTGGSFLHWLGIPPEIGIGLGLSTFFIALLGVAWPKRIAPGMIRYLPWPRLQSLQELLASMPINNTKNEPILQREFEDFTEESTLMAVLQNISQLKEVLHKEDKSLLKYWIKRRRLTRKRDSTQSLRIHQRYERLLYAEWKLRGESTESKDQWAKLLFKMVIGTAAGILVGATWRQIGVPTGWMLFEVILCGVIGMVAIDEFFGYLIMVTLYVSEIRSPFSVWLGVGSGIAFTLIWHFFIKRRRFKVALEAVKKQYGL